MSSLFILTAAKDQPSPLSFFCVVFVCLLVFVHLLRWGGGGYSSGCL